jgi:4-amino-4-deoxy-L-arabinose transferase-like glycosyltransferase
LRSIPRTVWLVVLVQTLVILCAGVLYPSFQEPDEVAHVDYVLAHRHGEWLDNPGQRFIQTGVLSAWSKVPQTQLRQHLGSTTVLPRSQRKSFDALGTAPVPNTGLPNQMVQHPPGYYALAAWWSYLLPGFSHHRFDIQLWWLRLLSVLMMLPVPILIFLAARRLTGHEATSLLAAILPLAIPTYIRTGASVSNDVLMLCAGSVLLYLLARVVTSDLTRRTAALVGVTWGIMLLGKAFALVMPPVIALAYLVGARGSLVSRIKQCWLAVVIAGAIGTALGGWWWVRNEVVYGTVQPRGYGPNWPATRLYGIHLGGTNGEWLRGVYRALAHRTFGSLGLIDQPSWSPHVLEAMFFAALGLIVIGIWRGYRGSPMPRSAAIVLALPIVLIVVVILQGIRSTWHTSRVIPGLQVRYLWANVLGLAVPAALGLRWLCERARVARFAVVIGAALAFGYQVSSTLLVLDSQFGTKGGTLAGRIRSGLHYVMNWYPFSPAVSGLLIVATTIAVIALFVVLVRDALHPQEPMALEDDQSLVETAVVS